MPDLLNPVNIFALFFEILIKGLFAFSIIKMLKEISPSHRKIEPRLVWLLIIPGFNLIWNFFVAVKIAASVKYELNSRNFEVKGNPTLVIGIIYATLSASALFIPVPTKITGNFGLLYGLLGLVAFIMFIQYWVKINWYRGVLIKDSAENEYKETV